MEQLLVIALVLACPVTRMLMMRRHGHGRGHGRDHRQDPADSEH